MPTRGGVGDRQHWCASEERRALIGFYKAIKIWDVNGFFFYPPGGINYVVLSEKKKAAQILMGRCVGHLEQKLTSDPRGPNLEVDFTMARCVHAFLFSR